MDIEGQHLANWYSPKLVKLKNQQLVQANRSVGIWEVDRAKPQLLLWHFNPTYSKPLASYGSHFNKQIYQADNTKDNLDSIAFLLPKKEGLEISRSKLPFSAIACFTDHCDFDTLHNLKLQRAFFKSHQVKITKGFFLNKHSKRPDTASYEKHSEEFKLWQEDNHELAYHSLSQSLKSKERSIGDFKSFEAPCGDITTWIDHGFQPYNASLYQNHESLKLSYGSLLKSKGIRFLWNYIDSGTSTKGVINMINPQHFTLKTFYNGIRHLALRQRFAIFIKNIIFHHLNAEDSLSAYRELSRYFKNFKTKRKIGYHYGHFKKMLRFILLLAPTIFNWRQDGRKIYPLANFVR